MALQSLLDSSDAALDIGCVYPTHSAHRNDAFGSR
jgi:hypothetical protein